MSSGLIKRCCSVSSLRTGCFSLLVGAVLCFVPGAGAQTPGDSVDVPGHPSLVLRAKGVGAQVYSCLAGTWTLQGPDANLLNPTGEVIGRHFTGPTWKLNDGSWVKGKAVVKQDSPEAKSVPWLLLESVGGEGSLAAVRYIQRTETHGGNAPSGSCRESAEVRVPYSAIYSFYVVNP
ncbi:DUF3455 domain-containing protein [Granulicella mallensis]|uniref:DUF3455 domain-containing protein n=1 Tax=Granulicella mallensis TaxID=940614 RepID=A0A7W8EAM2_9BACT|nr:DUF3455 domain-containing protein [Granulicella mallensis]MBB5064861.1 hypothetical protein [Granulicella mallensis]